MEKRKVIGILGVLLVALFVIVLKSYEAKLLRDPGYFWPSIPIIVGFWLIFVLARVLTKE